MNKYFIINNEYIIGDSYVDYIADKLDEEKALGNFKNYGVSGYTTDDVLNDIKRNDQKAHIKNAEVITLDVGANDLLKYIVTVDPITHLPQINTNPNKDEINIALANVYNNIKSIITEIKAINPNVKIYIMGYYNAFTYVTDETTRAKIVELIGFLNSSIMYASYTFASEKVPVTYVDTMLAMNASWFPTVEQPINPYIPNPYDIHPSLLGYKVIANEFLEVIK